MPVSSSRRGFLKTAALGTVTATSIVGCTSSDSDTTPEGGMDKLDIGIIALTDCSPFVIAHEKGFFKKYGIDSTIRKQMSWAAVRDSLSSGDIQCTHMLLGMPFASTMGLGGAPKKPMIVPWIVNRNGQAITLAEKYKGKVGADAKPLKAFVDDSKGKKPLAFAMTYPPGTHAMWIRYWLAAGGIQPGGANGEGADIKLTTVPPPQMVQNMKLGEVDGFCVGEPWNARCINEGIGFTATTTQEIWKDHPEKVAAFTKEFADKNPKIVKNALKALHEASVWLDDMTNRPEQCEIVSKTTYINCDPPTILARLQGTYDYGDGRKTQDPNYMIFSDRNCNYPQPVYGKWWLTQLRRWGFTDGAPDYEGVVKEVMRPDIYEEAMSEIGYKHGGKDDSAITFSDGVTFDPKGDMEKYAKGFAIGALKG